MLTWGLRALEIETLWGQGLTGAGVRVGHLDTGVAGDHPALAGRVASFLEVDEAGQPVEAAPPRDAQSHGTHTAGILCGGAMGPEHIGVAPAATLHSAAVIDGGRNIFRILRGLDWLRGSGVRVLCMALGVPEANPVFWTMLEALRAEGVLTVCPIGNDGPGVCHAPANQPGVLSVGAVDDDLRLASYTGRVLQDGACLKPEVLAPGTQIRSAHPRELEPTARSGTSQACAFVAGVASLLLEACPSATPAGLARALMRSALPLGEEDRCRTGLLQPGRALELLTQDPGGAGDEAPACPEPPFYRDPILLEERRRAAPDAFLECVVVASSQAMPDSQRGAAGPLMDRLTAELGESAERVEYLPAARIALVTGSPRLVKALSRDPEVTVLSAATARNPRSLW